MVFESVGGIEPLYSGATNSMAEAAEKASSTRPTYLVSGRRVERQFGLRQIDDLVGNRQLVCNLRESHSKLEVVAATGCTNQQHFDSSRSDACTPEIDSTAASVRTFYAPIGASDVGSIFR